MLHFESELAALKETLLQMGSRAEASVGSAVQALVLRDNSLAERVRKEDDWMDQLEVQLDDQCIHLLSKAPLASQLRLITVAMKTARDLERVGDEATTIARRAIALNQEPPIDVRTDVPAIAKLAQAMLKDALDAFVSGDTQKAREVIPQDIKVDSLHKQLQRDLEKYMVANPSCIGRCLHLMTISKCLERVADHAKNVAEEVVYLHDAIDIRHTHPESD